MQRRPWHSITAKQWRRTVHNAICCYRLLHDATRCYMMLYAATWCYTLLHDAICCYTLLHDAIYCYRLLHAATRRYMLIHPSQFRSYMWKKILEHDLDPHSVFRRGQKVNSFFIQVLSWSKGRRDDGSWSETWTRSRICPSFIHPSGSSASHDGSDPFPAPITWKHLESHQKLIS